MKRKRTFLSKLHTNGVYYIISGCILLLGIPLYQLLVLIPQGYSNALASASNENFTAYLVWIGNHTGQFIAYRALLIIAFALLLSFPFTLFRIIVAQEILGREEELEEESEPEETEEVQEEIDTENEDKEEQESGAMPAFAWRGKGYAVIAAWAGFLGIILFVLGTSASTVYLYVVGTSFTASISQYLASTNCSSACTSLSSTFTIIANTVGSGLLALACLFFGAVIARSGRNLWPGIWVAFSYMALAIAAILSGSAVEIVSAPTSGQATLTTPATLLFAIWVLWLGIMLVRLKPE
jgi:hypothetical protein